MIKGLEDPVYGSPLTGFETDGMKFRTRTADKVGPWISFESVKQAEEVAALIEKRIAEYQMRIDSAACDADTILPAQYKHIAERHLAIYRHVYIPCAKAWEEANILKLSVSIEAPVLSIPEPEVFEPVQEKDSTPIGYRTEMVSAPTIESTENQFSLF